MKVYEILCCVCTVVHLMQVSTDSSGQLNPNTHQLNRGIMEQTNYGDYIIYAGSHRII